MRGIFFLAISFVFARQALATPTPTVLVQVAKLGEISDVLTYPARVVPKINAAVLSEIDGVVTKITAPLGHAVKRGQKLLVLQHTDPAYEYAPMVVKSPVRGVVSLMDVTEGSRVAKGQKIAAVTDPAQLRVLVEIASSDLTSVSTNLAGELKLSDRDTTVPLKIKGLSPFVDPATGTASCELDIDVKSAGRLSLSPGVVGQVTFKVNSHQGFSVADSAVIYRGKKPFIRVVEGGKSKIRAVTLGRRQRGTVEILSGLSEGMQIIERASAFISDGEVVAVETQ